LKTKKIFFKLWEESFFWTEFIEFQYELRAHIVGGNMERLFIKKWNLEEIPKISYKKF